MNYSDKTLLVLDQIKKQDDSIVACFAFGSFVTEETSSKNYREVRIFDGTEFIMSKFNLTNIYPDIDIICISNNPEKTAKLFDKNFDNVLEKTIEFNPDIIGITSMTNDYNKAIEFANQIKVYEEYSKI